MKPIRMGVAAAFAALVLGVGTPTTAQAQFSFWNFNGNCIDCAQTAGTGTYAVSGLLTLTNYTPGSLIEHENFVSFVYNGSNLLDPYTVLTEGSTDLITTPWAHTFYDVTGSLGGSVESLYLSFGDGLEFGYDTPGDWFTCGAKGDYYYAVACSWQANADYGTGSFSPNAVSTVPEPSTYALMAAGLGALVAFRRRRSVN